VVGPMTTLIARLHPPERKEGVRYNGLRCVEFDGELIIVGSRDPEHDWHAPCWLAVSRVRRLWGAAGPRSIVGEKPRQERTPGGGEFNHLMHIASFRADPIRLQTA
jgi:hypothetical protein